MPVLDATHPSLDVLRESRAACGLLPCLAHAISRHCGSDNRHSSIACPAGASSVQQPSDPNRNPRANSMCSLSLGLCQLRHSRDQLSPDRSQELPRSFKGSVVSTQKKQGRQYRHDGKSAQISGVITEETSAVSDQDSALDLASVLEQDGTPNFERESTVQLLKKGTGERWAKHAMQSSSHRPKPPKPSAHTSCRYGDRGHHPGLHFVSVAMHLPETCGFAGAWNFSSPEVIKNCSGARSVSQPGPDWNGAKVVDLSLFAAASFPRPASMQSSQRMGAKPVGSALLACVRVAAQAKRSCKLALANFPAPRC